MVRAQGANGVMKSARRTGSYRFSLRTRLLVMLSPLLAALLGLSLLIVGPYASVGKLVENADRELKQVLVGLQYGRLFAEQSKHFAEYVYLPARSRIGVREEIQAINDAEARTYWRLLEVAGGVEPEELRTYERAHGLFQQLHDAGAAMMRLAEAGRVERAREVLVSRVLPLSDRAVEKLIDVAADDETERNEYLAQAGGSRRVCVSCPGRTCQR